MGCLRRGIASGLRLLAAGLGLLTSGRSSSLFLPSLLLVSPRRAVSSPSSCEIPGTTGCSTASSVLARREGSWRWNYSQFAPGTGHGVYPLDWISPAGSLPAKYLHLKIINITSISLLPANWCRRLAAGWYSLVGRISCCRSTRTSHATTWHSSSFFFTLFVLILQNTK